MRNVEQNIGVRVLVVLEFFEYTRADQVVPLYTVIYNIGTLTMTHRHDTITNLNWVPIHLISVVAAWMLFNRLGSRLVFNYYLLVYIKIKCSCVSRHIIPTYLYYCRHI